MPSTLKLLPVLFLPLHRVRSTEFLRRLRDAETLNSLIHRSSRSIGNNHLLQAVNRQAVKGHLQIWRRPTTPSRRSHGGQRGSGTNPLSRPKPPKAVADRPAFTRGSFRSHHHSMRSGATVAHPPRPRWHLHPRPALGMRQLTPNSEEPLKVVCILNLLSLNPAV